MLPELIWVSQEYMYMSYRVGIRILLEVIVAIIEVVYTYNITIIHH